MAKQADLPGIDKRCPTNVACRVVIVEIVNAEWMHARVNREQIAESLYPSAFQAIVIRRLTKLKIS